MKYKINKFVVCFILYTSTFHLYGKVEYLRDRPGDLQISLATAAQLASISAFPLGISHIYIINRKPAFVYDK